MGRFRIWHEPLVHFFTLGAMLFAVDYVQRDEPREVIVTPGVKADLERRFHDGRGRAPNPKEREDSLVRWKRDEALYREALQRKLDHNDVTVRTYLIEKMRAEAELEVSVPAPSDAELEGWIQSHREKYEMPRRYQFQFIVFPKSEAEVEAHLNQAFERLRAGAQPADLGRPVLAGKLLEKELPERLAAPLARQIVQLGPSEWTRVDGESDLWLLRVVAILGGMPNLADIRPSVVDDYLNARKEEAIERVLKKTVDLYHFEDTTDAP